jgi:hypothetical protein
MVAIAHTPNRSPLGAFMRSPLGVRGSFRGLSYHYAIGLGDGRARVFTGEMIKLESGVRRALPATFLSGSFIDVDSSLHDIREHEVVIARREPGEAWGWYRPVASQGSPGGPGAIAWDMAIDLGTAVTLHGYHALTHDDSYLTLDPQPWSWPGFQAMVAESGTPWLWGQRSGNAVYVARINDGSVIARLFRAGGSARTPSRIYDLPENWELEDDAVVDTDNYEAQPKDYVATGCGGVDIVDGWATGNRALRLHYGASSNGHYLIGAECVDRSVYTYVSPHFDIPPVLTIGLTAYSTYRLKVQRVDRVTVKDEYQGPYLPQYRAQGKAFSAGGTSSNPYVGGTSYSRLGWLAGVGGSGSEIRLDRHQHMTDQFGVSFPLVFRDWYDTSQVFSHVSLDGSGIDSGPQQRTVGCSNTWCGVDVWGDPIPYYRWIIEYEATTYPYHGVQVRVEAGDVFSP